MRKTCTMTVVAALLALPSMALAADKCPTELSEAKAMLGKATATSKKSEAAQPPRQLAGAKTQDVQAPRAGTQDVQAPRAGTPPQANIQDVQAGRAGTQQAPRASTQDVQAPRASTQDVQAPRSENVAKARKLIADSEAACKKGDMALSTGKAKEAMGLLK
jgi:hypothetical protein